MDKSPTLPLLRRRRGVPADPVPHLRQVPRDKGQSDIQYNQRSRWVGGRGRGTRSVLYVSMRVDLGPRVSDAAARMAVAGRPAKTRVLAWWRFANRIYIP